MTKSEADQRAFAQSFFSRLPQRLANSGATAEIWLDNVISSPSLQYVVHKNGMIELVSTHDQILEGAEKWYVGCIYPAENVKDAMLKEGERFMRALQNEGFEGHCGLDLIVTTDSYYFVEANVRKPGTTYPREFVKRVYGTLEGRHYYARDVMKSDLKGKTFSEVYSMLGDLVITDPSQPEGVLIYNTAALREGARFDVIVVSDKRENLSGLMEQALKRL